MKPVILFKLMRIWKFTCEELKCGGAGGRQKRNIEFNSIKEEARS